MIEYPPKQITSHITLLGRPESNVHLVRSNGCAAILGGGMSYIVPELLEQLHTLSVDLKDLTHLVILHSHFDHVGIAPALRRMCPNLKIFASSQGKRILAKESVQNSIALLNKQASDLMGITDRISQMEATYTLFQVDEELADGQDFLVGNLLFKVLAVPGHSSCSIALYLPQERALFPSDAAGVRFKDFFLSAGNSNFELYEMNLLKLSELQPEIILPEHYGTLTGTEARQHFSLAIREASAMKEKLINSISQHRDVATSTREITDSLCPNTPDGFMPRPVLEMVIGQMVRFYAQQLGIS